ncbi:hypothetical protein SAMN04515672_2848 [Natronorubrum texcoconense]|uniref:Uncharacterized protein n=1 Tax=Natronorubrum texcoconense TaxID=1095776 RepID=A0A1G9B739_9EURY|nr:hypothetical protein SAMN04515672_2848 [Natronorubrum texcoconense]
MGHPLYQSTVDKQIRNMLILSNLSVQTYIIDSFYSGN